MENLKKLILSLLILLSVVIFSGCELEDDIPDIYASIYPIEFIVKEIVGDELTVKSVYPRGKDVHDHELSPKDIINISKSKLLFFIGIGLEAMIEQSQNSTLKNVPKVRLSDGMDLIEINSKDIHDHDDHNHEDGELVFYDPHIWLDLNKMQIMTSKILVAILENFELTEDQKAKFKTNANELVQKLDDLDKKYFELINSSDVLHKTILVDHDAYIYWEARYGLERIRIRNDNESTDAIPKDMIEKINEAKAKKIKYICLTKNEIASSIADQYRVQLGLDNNAFLYLHHLATITAAEENAGMDYLSLMEYNLDILKQALPRK